MIWKHFPLYWPFCAGKLPVNLWSPARSPIKQSLYVFFVWSLSYVLSEKQSSSQPTGRCTNETPTRGCDVMDPNLLQMPDTVCFVVHIKSEFDWPVIEALILIWHHCDDSPLQWRHNGRDSVSNHQSHDCLLNRYSDADQWKHQSSASLAFVRGIHRWPVNSPHKWPVTRKMFPFDDVIMHLASYGHLFIIWSRKPTGLSLIH